MSHTEPSQSSIDELSQVVRAQQRQIAALSEWLAVLRPGGRRQRHAAEQELLSNTMSVHRIKYQPGRHRAAGPRRCGPG